MNNKPVERTQADGLQEEYSAIDTIDTTNMPDLTRQEYRTEADVNYILSKFGVNGTNQRPIQFGEVNFDMDLQQALGVMDDAKRVHRTLPEPLKERYPTPGAMLQALENGEMDTTIKQLKKLNDEKNEAAARAKQDMIDLENYRKGVPPKKDTPT